MPSAPTATVEADAAARKARDPRELAAYYAPGVEAWYADRATRRGDAVVIPGNHDHNFRLLAFLRRFEPPSGGFHHLDVGCGAGLYAVSVLLRHPSATVTGVDISAKNLLAAERLASRMGVRDRLSLVRSDANALPLRARPDTILCSEIVEHLPDPRPLLASLRKLAKPTTRFYVSVPHIDTKNQGDIMYVLSDAKGRKLGESSDAASLAGEGTLTAYYHHLYTEEEIANVLGESGFEPTGVDGANLRFPPRYPWISFGLKTVFRSASLDLWLNRATRRRYAGNLLLACRPSGRP